MKVRTLLMLSLLLFAMLAAPPVSAESTRMTASPNQSDGSESAGISRAFVPSDNQQQKAAGELAMTSLERLTVAPDLRTGELVNLCVHNYRGNAASNVWVEIWTSSQVPQIGGNLTHHTGLTYLIGTVSAYSTRCVSTGAVPLTPPDPGLYWVSIAIYEGSGASRTLQYIYTDTSKVDAGGPITNSNLAFEAPVSHYITNGGNTASIQVGRIRNGRSSTSGKLYLELWATEDVPRWGDTISYELLASKEYQALLPGYVYNNVDTGSLAVAQPPAGSYWISAVLNELSTDGNLYYTCFYTFYSKYTFSGTAAPTAEFVFTPFSPVVGQAVSFTDSSTGGPTSWSWSFGNGATSTTRSPTYTYSVAGTYNVSLTATNSGGSNTKTKSITVAALSAPTITYFGANPPAVASGQQTTLTWTSTGGTSASIDQGIGSVATSGSKTITPTIGVPYKLTVTGPGGSTNATVTISAVPSSYAGTWLLPSSARVSGQGAFWTTDLVLLNTGTATATVNVKFLGHTGAGAAGPEQTYYIPARATYSFPDVLSYAFGRESDWGPILIRSSVATMAVQGQTWTAAPTGGSYGQAVPALGSTEFVGSTPKGLAGLRQDSQFRTNIVLANVKESDAAVTLQVLLPDGTTVTSQTFTVGPLGFLQLNLANNLGIMSFAGGSVLVSCSTPGCQVAAYASVIDAATADPRTILAR